MIRGAGESFAVPAKIALFTTVGNTHQTRYCDCDAYYQKFKDPDCDDDYRKKSKFSFLQSILRKRKSPSENCSPRINQSKTVSAQ